MSDWVRRRLAELVAQDPSIGGDARRCEALLRDLCRNQHKKEITALVTAVRERLVDEIRYRSASVPPHALIGRLLQRLHDDCGLREDVSRWTIETWAAAYDVPVTTDQTAPDALSAGSDSSQHAAVPPFLQSQATHRVERHFDEFENHTTLTIPSGRIQWRPPQPSPEVLIQLELRATIEPAGTLVEAFCQFAAPDYVDVCEVRMILLCDGGILSFPFDFRTTFGPVPRSADRFSGSDTDTIDGYEGVLDFRGGESYYDSETLDRALCCAHLETICRANVVKIRFVLPPTVRTEPDEAFCRGFQDLCGAIYRAAYVDSATVVPTHAPVADSAATKSMPPDTRFDWNYEMRVWLKGE